MAAIQQGHGVTKALPLGQYFYFNKTDGGRRDCGYQREKLDCTVRALAIAKGILYGEAHEIIKAGGRRDRCRFKMEPFMKTLPYAEPLPIPQKPRTYIGDFVRLYPEGRYIVRVSGHAYAVIDGVVHDTFPVKARAAIRQAWKIN